MVPGSTSPEGLLQDVSSRSPIPARVAVVGGGTVGASWAAYFLAHGLDVSATDPDPSGEQLLRRRIEQAWPALEAMGLSPGAGVARLSFSADLEEALDGADYVQECAPEREELKIDLLGRIDGALDPEVVIASSSSGLLISRLQSSCTHPERCLIAHPFNPPHLMPLVELVGGSGTSQETIERAADFYRAIGKHPIVVRKEVVGHIANRFQAAIIREAAHLLREDVASAEDIDAAIVYGPGARWAMMGPLLTFHLAGGEGGIAHFLDHLGDAYNDWIADLGTNFLTREDADLLRKGIEDEVAGRSPDELARRRDEGLLKLLREIEPL